MKKEILNPPALGAPPRFYSHAVAFEGPAKLVYVSGQVSMDEEGKVVAAGGELPASTRVGASKKPAKARKKKKR